MRYIHWSRALSNPDCYLIADTTVQPLTINRERRNLHPDSNTPRLDTEGTWHTLWWEHQPMLGTPFSADALAYAKRLALENDRFPDTAKALAELLQRWGAGLADTPAERRIALRAAASQSALPLPGTGGPHSESLTITESQGAEPQDQADEEDEPSRVDAETFYADAWQALS